MTREELEERLASAEIEMQRSRIEISEATTRAHNFELMLGRVVPRLPADEPLRPVAESLLRRLADPRSILRSGELAAPTAGGIVRGDGWAHALAVARGEAMSDADLRQVAEFASGLRGAIEPDDDDPGDETWGRRVISGEGEPR